jgi:hypothetical protein
MSMPLRTATLGLMLATAVLSFPTHSAQGADSIAGTWELNVAKSKSTAPLPMSQTRTYEVTGQQEKMIAKGVDAQGKPTLSQFTANRDGKDYPFESPGADMISLTPVDGSTNNYVVKNAGKEMITGTRVISKDGKVMTLSSKGTDAAGKPTESTLVFDKS